MERPPKNKTKKRDDRRCEPRKGFYAFSGRDRMVGCDRDGAIRGEHSLFGGLGGSTGDVAATLICSTGYLTLLPGHTQL